MYVAALKVERANVAGGKPVNTARLAAIDAELAKHDPKPQRGTRKS